MRDNFLISIKGTQLIGDHVEKTEFTTKGNYIVNGNKKYIIYREYKNTLLNSPVTAVLELEDDRMLTLSHRGESETNLILENGKRHMCCYDTSMGSMLVGIFTKKIKSQLNRNGGKLEVEYSLDMNCDINSEHKLSLNIRNIEKEKEKDHINVENIIES